MSRVSDALDAERTGRASADSRAAVAESQLASTAEMLRELLKAAEERSARAGAPLAPARQPGVLSNEV